MGDRSPTRVWALPGGRIAVRALPLAAADTWVLIDQLGRTSVRTGALSPDAVEITHRPAGAPPAPVKATSSLLVYAFRYAIGRRTYAVTDVAQALIAQRDLLTVQDRSQVVAEIRAAVAGGRAGDASDVKAWSRVADALLAVRR